MVLCVRTTQDYEDQSFIPLPLRMLGTSQDDVVQEFLPADDEDQGSVELHESGLLESLTVGSNSFGVYLGFTGDGTHLHIEFIMFRRGNRVRVVYTYILLSTRPIVSVEAAARSLDGKMNEIMSAR